MLKFEIQVVHTMSLCFTTARNPGEAESRFYIYTMQFGVHKMDSDIEFKKKIATLLKCLNPILPGFFSSRKVFTL